MANAINVIYPYKNVGMWVFDDERVGLDREPFVAGADTMIDQVLALKGLKNPEEGFRLVFSAGDVRLEIYNIIGQKVATLVNEKLSAGEYVVQWDGRDQSGVTVSSGIYFYRLEAGNVIISKKMLLLQ